MKPSAASICSMSKRVFFAMGLAIARPTLPRQPVKAASPRFTMAPCPFPFVLMVGLFPLGGGPKRAPRAVNAGHGVCLGRSRSARSGYRGRVREDPAPSRRLRVLVVATTLAFLAGACGGSGPLDGEALSH